MPDGTVEHHEQRKDCARTVEDTLIQDARPPRRGQHVAGDLPRAVRSVGVHHDEL